MNGSELGDLGVRAPSLDEQTEQNVGEPGAAAQQETREQSLSAGDHRRSDGESRPLPRLTSPTIWEGDADVSPLAGRQVRSLSFDLPLPELELPAPALAPLPPARTAEPRIPARPISNMDRRAMALGTPKIASNPSPRARFNLANSPQSPNGIPLRPILNPPTLSSPNIRPTPTKEKDITESIRRHGGDRSNASSPEPAFAPRADDEPHPERTTREERTPHPLYTPAPRRSKRRRRGKALSVASNRSGRSGRSGRSSRSARSRVKSAWRTVRRKGRRHRSHHHRHHHSGGSSSSSSSSSSTSSSGSSDSSTQGSSRSSSTWGGWRFWRNSSSGSSSSSESDSDSEWEPPTPHFTLLTPCLTRAPQHAYPSHLFSGGQAASMPSTPGPGVEIGGPPVFDLLNTATLTPALERLQQFWLERRQEDCVAGDLGAGMSTGMNVEPKMDDVGYFPSMDEDHEGEDIGRSDMATRDNTPAATPGLPTTPGGAPGPRKLRGEQRAAKAEEKRLGKGKGTEEGPAWWLDVMCPTVADMRELRKILPLHPLTMEDILHQETREKIESFPSLGYYFIVFRALDETYFQYTSPDATPSSSTENVGDSAEQQKTRKRESEQLAGASSGRKGRVDIVEGVGGKEGVEGVGVGAVNLYLVVFADGILSFHFEDITKHVERVQGKLQSFGLSRTMSSHWIAYGLMDSIVDAFFPLIDYIEGESNEVDTFLSDPLNTKQVSADNTSKVASSGVGVIAGRQVYDEDVVGIVVEPPTDDEKIRANLKDSSASASVKKATVRRQATTSVLRWLPVVPLPGFLLRILPDAWSTRTIKTFDSTMLVDSHGYKLYPLSSSLPVEGATPLREDGGVFIGDTKFDRTIMLKRIADNRKLVTGLSRLLGPKMDVVRGLRKRTKEERMGLFRSNDSRQDIAIYIGDLYDHIVSMQQSLNFYDAILSHDHPAYLGVLRLSLVSAKAGTDMALVKLYIVTLTFLPINILTGCFSSNVKIPTNGDRHTHLKADGTRAGYHIFGMIVGGVFVVAAVTWLGVWLIFQSSKRKYKRQGAPTDR